MTTTKQTQGRYDHPDPRKRPMQGAPRVALVALAISVAASIAVAIAAIAAIASFTVGTQSALAAQPALPAQPVASPSQTTMDKGQQQAKARPQRAVMPGDCPAWNIVPSSNPGTNWNHLNGVAAISATDVWAVGYYYNGVGASQTLMERWNGTTFHVVSSPNVGTYTNQLNGVAAVSASDVWVVGYYADAISMSRTLIEHWDGSAWAVIPSPNGGPSYNVLTGVAAASANDVWAVGYYFVNVDEALVEHWNGSGWTIVPTPMSSSPNHFTGVAAVSANDVWAVGYLQTGPTTLLTMIQHWDGSSWAVVSSPSPGPLSNYLSGIAAVSTSDVWAVGNYANTTSLERQHVGCSPQPQCWSYLGLSLWSSSSIGQRCMGCGGLCYRKRGADAGAKI